MRQSAATVTCAVGLVIGLGVAAGPGLVELQPPTLSAYDAYVAHARGLFLERVRADAGPCPAPGDRRPEGVGPSPDGRIVKIAGGLVHHWRGAVRIPGVTLARALDVSRSYEAYPGIHPEVVDSRVISQDGRRFVIVTRIRSGTAGVTAVLQMRSVVTYHVDTTTAFAIGETEEVREVVHAGQPDERLLPQGRDSGFLWRAHTFTRFVARDGGVDVELETLGLSRRFPRLLGWLIEPIARSLGRRSVESTLLQFSRAVRGGAGASGSTP